MLIVLRLIRKEFRLTGMICVEYLVQMTPVAVMAAQGRSSNFHRKGSCKGVSTHQMNKLLIKESSQALAA